MVNVDLIEIVGGWVENWCWNWWVVVVRHWCSRYRWMIRFRYREGICWSRGVGRNRYRWYGLWMICINNWCRWMVRFRYYRWMYRYRWRWRRYWSWWVGYRWLIRGRWRMRGRYRYRCWWEWNRWLVRGRWRRRMRSRYRARVWMVMQVWWWLHWLPNSKTDKGLNHVVSVLG